MRKIRGSAEQSFCAALDFFTVLCYNCYNKELMERFASVCCTAGFICFHAAVTKSVDVADLKSVGVSHAGSSPASGTKKAPVFAGAFFDGVSPRTGGQSESNTGKNGMLSDRVKQHTASVLRFMFIAARPVQTAGRASGRSVCRPASFQNAGARRRAIQRSRFRRRRR